MDDLEKELFNLGNEDKKMPKSVRTKVALSYHMIRHSHKNKSHKKIIAAAASIAAIMFIGASFTPKVRASIYSIYKNLGNEALSHSAQNDYIQYEKNIYTKSQNMDIRLSNIIKDSRTLSLNFQVIYKNDSYNKSYTCLNLANSMIIKDDKENIIFDGPAYKKACDKGIPYEGKLTDIGESYTIKDNIVNEIVTIESDKTPLPKTSSLHVIIPQVTATRDDKTVFTDNIGWNFKLPIDAKFSEIKSRNFYLKENSDVIDVVSAHTTPSGLNIKYKYTNKFIDSSANGDILFITVQSDNSLEQFQVEEVDDGNNYSISCSNYSYFDDIKGFTVTFYTRDNAYTIHLIRG